MFKWRAADGSEVLTYRDDSPYNEETGKAIDKASAQPYDTMLVYGVTDHGGAPTKKAIEEIYSKDNAVFSTAENFFEGRTTDYTVEGELVTGDFGVYANHPEIKSLNRAAEYALLNAEKASVIAGSYDRAALRKCWQDTLFNQFHDILGGACIKDAYVDAKNLYGRAISTAEEIIHYKLLSVTNRINLPGKNPDDIWNIVVWNLNAEPYHGYIEAEVQWAHEFPWYDKGIALEDAQGNRYDCQVIRELSVIPRFRSRFLFKAQIPPTGYKAFKLIKTEQEIEKKKREDFSVIDTRRYRFTLSYHGTITGVYDKTARRAVVKELLRPICVKDDGDTWAFNIAGCTEACEPFVLERIESVENGDLRSVLKLTYSFRSSKLFLYYVFYENESYMDVKYRVNWNEKHLTLKLVTELDGSEHTVATAYGSVARGRTEAEVPMGEWLAGGGLLFSVKNAFSYNMIDGKLGITVLRSAIYGDLRIADIDLEEDYDILSQGITEGAIRVSFSHARSEFTVSAELNNPPIVLCEANHGGELKPEGSFLSCGGSGVSLTVMKKSEDGEYTVLRGVELLGEAKTVTITLNGVEYPLSVNPYEIFTVRVDGANLTKVNMLEE